jgi:glycosyltransferase involved in cell wall biosynthesis
MPKVSVIVPNYNHAPYLRQRIDSILAQTFQDFELILLDDASTDDSRSILSSYSGNPHVSAIHFNEKNSGSTFKQWNKGVRPARGEYIWIAESDDYADPRFLERLVPILDTKPQVVFVNCRSFRTNASGASDGYADWYLADIHPDKWTSDFEADGPEECRTYMVQRNTICNASSVLFRSSAYHRAGGADETLKFCGDWKLWAGMALNGRIAHLGEALNYHRVHDASASSRSGQHGQAAAEYLRVVRWILRHIKPTDNTIESVRRFLSAIWIPAMVSGGAPLGRRFRILWDAMSVDHQALRKLGPPLFAAARIKLSQLADNHVR